MKWLLFGLMAATVPVLYFMFVIAGFLPLIEIVRMMREGTWGFRLFNGVYILIYGALFYFAAHFIARALERLPVAGRLIGLAAIATGLIAMSFLPIYGVGHSAPAGVSVYRLLFPRPLQVPMVATPDEPPPPPARAPAGPTSHKAATAAR